MNGNGGRDRIPGGALPPFIPGKGIIRTGRGGGPGPAPVPWSGGGAPALGGGGLAASVSLDPPTWVRPPSARDFLLSGTLAGVMAPPVTPAPIPGAGFTVPTGNVGVIRSVVFLVNGLLVTSQISFTLTFNLAPVEGWTNVPVLPRLAASMATSFGPDETAIPVPENTAIGVVVAVAPADGAAYQVSAFVRGWFYPKEIGQAFDAAYLGM